VTGGVDANTNAQSVIYYAKVNSDGTLGSWQNGPSLPQPTYYHRVVIHDEKLVVIAGKGNAGEFNLVHSATINTSNGSLGSWTAEPSVPISLYRFAAVSVEKYGSEYIYVIGGFSNGQVQTNVYHSAAPPTPTPTTTPTPVPTNTPTPTPTPPAIVYASLSNQPSHWVAVGQDVVYTIRYGNNGVSTVSNATIRSVIPANTELVSGTVTEPPAAEVSASSAGGLISWDIGTLPPNTNGTVTYTVRRIQPPPSSNIGSVLDLEIQGPTTATANTMITYTLAVINQGILLKNAEVFVKVPSGSTYISSSNNGTRIDDMIKWDIQTLPSSSTTIVSFVLSAPQTIIINDYSAQAVIPEYSPPSNMATTIEDEILITNINGLPPTGAGDSVTISNNGATFSWNYNGQPGNISLDSVTNPAVANSEPQGIYSYLPLITR